MCDPIAIAGFAISAVSTAVGYSQQAAAYEENAKAANEAANRKYFDTNLRILQEKQSAALDKADVNKEARAARATAQVAAGEAGVTGNSVDLLLRDYLGRADDYRGRVNTQTDWTIAQLNREKLGIQAEAKDRINSVSRPNFFDAGLRILGSGLDSYSDYSRRQKAKE